jgi:ribosome recycling factor
MDAVELDKHLKEVQGGMDHSIEHLQDELKKVRAGKASPDMVGGVKVDYYGSPTPIGQVANVSTGDSRTLVIQPWEKSMLAVIERAIFEANLGLTPMNDGEIIRITIPPLTEERRLDLVKRVKKLGEEAKVSIRNERHKGMDGIKAAVKNGYPEDNGKRKESEVQAMTDKHIEKVDALVEHKEKDIMTI